ncbi:hypothetical protein EDD21DRAFT_379981 [Dissophora ornata]|nr:hypothetical protein EDD21DRAFT_379981 [Dissophora ornata]
MTPVVIHFPFIFFSRCCLLLSFAHMFSARSSTPLSLSLLLPVFLIHTTQWC